MQRIFLIGYMGTGKTTAGHSLATQLGLSFFDLDHYIEARFQKSISQLFEEEGENRFREIESAMLHELGEFENVVIATGGGTPCFFDNMKFMNNNGYTIYMKASPRALTERLDGCRAKRPLIRDKTKDELFDFVTKNLEEREFFYSQAKLIFETEYLVNRSMVNEYVEKMINALEEKGEL